MYRDKSLSGCLKRIESSEITKEDFILSKKAVPHLLMHLSVDLEAKRNSHAWCLKKEKPDRLTK